MSQNISLQIVASALKTVLSFTGHAITGSPNYAVTVTVADAAAILSNVDTGAIYRRVEAGAIHFAEMPKGLVLICLNSLLIASDRESLR